VLVNSGIDYVEGAIPAPIHDTAILCQRSRSSITPSFNGVRHDPAPGPLGTRMTGLAGCWKPKPTLRYVLLAKSSRYCQGAGGAWKTTNEEGKGKSGVDSATSVVKAAKAQARSHDRLRALLRMATRRRRGFALATTAPRQLDSGARWVVLCDTNGGTLPPRGVTIVPRDQTYSRRSCRDFTL